MSLIDWFILIVGGGTAASGTIAARYADRKLDEAQSLLRRAVAYRDAAVAAEVRTAASYLRISTTLRDFVRGVPGSVIAVDDEVPS